MTIPRCRRHGTGRPSTAKTDFLRAATAFLDLPIEAALGSDDPIIRILAILDRRVGRRTLQKIRQQAPDLPPWVRQFYDLRLSTM